MYRYHTLLATATGDSEGAPNGPHVHSRLHGCSGLQCPVSTSVWQTASVVFRRGPNPPHAPGPARGGGPVAIG